MSSIRIMLIVLGTRFYRFSACGEDAFACYDGECIEVNSLCDGFNDCATEEDEYGCVAPEPCSGFTCMDKKTCIKTYQYCDGTKHCPNGDDELICGGCPRGYLTCLLDGACVHSSKVCDNKADCLAAEDEFLCKTGDGCDLFQGRFFCDGKCYLEYKKCDGKVNCPTGADEKGCTGCNANFQCKDGSCRSFLKVCNGVKDCPGGEDEGSQCECPNGGFRCIGGKCIDGSKYCNGKADCPGSDDEIATKCVCGSDIIRDYLNGCSGAASVGMSIMVFGICVVGALYVIT